MTQLAGEVNRSGAACAKLESVLGEVRSNGVISIDIETYSPNGKPWETWVDPIVSIAMVYSKTINPIDGCLTQCLVETPQSEAELLRKFIKILDALDCPRIWFFGYGIGRFDYPYLQSRAEIHQLDADIREAVDRQANYDVCDLAKHAFGLSPDSRLSMARTEELLGIRRTSDKSILNGANFHNAYDSWRHNEEKQAIWYNQEDAINTLLILWKLSSFTIPSRRS